MVFKSNFLRGENGEKNYIILDILFLILFSQ